MAADDDIDARSELESRVYSRSGSDEPRIARYDHASDRVLELTESEWQLLEIERERAGRKEAPSPAPEGALPFAEPPELPIGGVPSPQRRRLTPLSAGVIGVIVGAALCATWIGLGEAVNRPPGFDITITPTPTADPDSALPAGAALDFFRDPRRGNGMLPGEGFVPGWLNSRFERSDVARIIGPDGPAAGLTVYAAVVASPANSDNPELSRNGLTCLIVELETTGMVLNCASLERVLERGMTMHAAIPRGVGTRLDQDGDGVMGRASETDVLTVEWRPDGSFVVTRHAQ
ncbi:hypothetical protein [Agromyces albus]|uniref:hypothetical protein n=1 Tax=Agromyces albus TaxID=205332 RepID=UPI00277EA5A8|nr:hypothetical protein [Agromyces albus]MDQ0574927.1 hypothetical protein [Agromyces albus]